MRGPGTGRAVGWVGSRYLELVRATTRFVEDPPNPYETLDIRMPAIVAVWHGQHFMTYFARRSGDRIAGLISRSADGELVAGVLARLDVRPIRGSGARGRDPRQKGGAAALREMLRALRSGESVVMTADVPKIPRRCGAGIVTLAQHSGRPIVPLAVVTRRRADFRSWDRASLGLPFGRGAMAFGEPMTVARDCDPTEFERCRAALQASLDEVHGRAYGLVGDTDPGAGLRG